MGLVPLQGNEEYRALSLPCEDTGTRQPSMNRKWALTRHQIRSTLILAKPPELWEINVCYLSHPVYGIFCYSSFNWWRQPVYKKQKITSADKDMEKSEPLFIVGGNVKWCSYYGKQYGNFYKIKNRTGNSLAVQWLGFQASTAGGRGSIPGRGTKILNVTWRGQKINK